MIERKSKDEIEQTSAVAAAGRLFRAYEQHCRRPGVDTLFNTLTSMHSLNDRLRSAVDHDFHKIDEFVALKALRNFTHHQEEVRANVCVIPSPAMSDLLFLCIVRRDQVERAIESVDKRWRAHTRGACEGKFHWYGPAVNINPCLFNFMVRAYELLMEFDVFPPKDAVESFENSYQLEVENGQSHFVDGRFESHAADVQAVLLAVVAELPKPQAS
ncbi:hypothetical protein JQ609_06840 [Bradyrhizobium sp. AUGA SZCCT0169]|uniref:hypothetical protein n=1 Tax=Bradyrhizobium sp. AUGA SZCCT0169 TaxID=2807663 RepID=UPI001BA6DC49|nr:hypothetical protein [Bradyrhizobium sp. AUGA SZCCT0169]MBR1246646.1 hypothetical protein [Bradyrhizobium sp. AUGA SZCCT0169]